MALLEHLLNLPLLEYSAVPYTFEYAIDEFDFISCGAVLAHLTSQTYLHH